MTITELAQAIEAEGPKPAPSVLPAPFSKEDDVAKIGPKEAALQAAREDDLSIPKALDRTIGMTKEDMDKLHDKLSKPARTGTPKLKVVVPSRPATLTEADKKAIAELKKAEKLAAKEKAAEKAAAAKEARAEQKAVRDAAKKAKAAPKGSPEASGGFPVAANPEKAHPADQHRTAGPKEIEEADHFEVKLFKGGQWQTEKFQALGLAWDHVKATFDASSRRPLVYAAAKDGSLALVAPEKPTGAPKAAKAPKAQAAPRAAQAKPAKAPSGRYDWEAAEAKAAEGKIPAPPPLTAGTGQLGRLTKVVDLAKAKDAKGLGEYKSLQPTNYGAKVVIRYAALCIKALKAQ